MYASEIPKISFYKNDFNQFLTGQSLSPTNSLTNHIKNTISGLAALKIFYDIESSYIALSFERIKG